MKKILSLLAFLPLAAIGQNQNYVKSTTYKTPTTASIGTPSPSQAAVQITYLDGLGRPIQQVAHRQSATGKNIVTPIAYDALGRQAKEYLPFPSSSTSLAYDPSALDNLSTYYTSDAPPSNPGFETTNNPYSEKLFEASPLNRVLKQAAPGNAWAMESGREIKFDYLANSTADEVRLFTATAAWNASLGLYGTSLSQAGTSHYAANELYKTATKDENWAHSSPLRGITEEFKDKEGRVVLKRTYGESVVNGTAMPDERHDTYYAYDQFGNLAYVFPPKADGTITETVLDNLCYQYRYDSRNRLVEKKLPGKQWEFIIYDRLDRVVATGPALSPFSDFGVPSNIGWLITKYDAFGRPAYTGWMPSATLTSSERKTIQEARNAQTANLNEARATATTFNGIAIGYTNQAWPTGSGYHLLSINYYDGYDFPNGPTDFSNVEGQPVYYNLTQKPTGLATGSWTRTLQSSTSYAGETAYSLYDKKGRVLRTKAINYLGGYTTTDNKIDAFSGRLDHSVTYHKRASGSKGSPEIYVKDIYAYTEQDRLLSHLHQIGPNGVPQLLAKNEYDELGQLTAKKVGGSDITAAAYLQKVDYSYTVRGWLKEINSVDHFDDTDAGTDLFAFKVNYDRVENDFGGQIKPLSNGNIVETFWKSRSDGHKRGYGYSYDALNRLRKALYHKNDQPTRSYDEQMDYDKNGNIMSLERNGDLDYENFLIEIDDLDYTYDAGNRLQKVTDNSIHPAGFRDQADSTVEYFYDDNGNMTADENKKITVSYNHLNLPVEIIFRDGSGKINYLYDASGKKLKKTVTQGSVVTETDYLSGFQYRSGVLDFFPTAEGYVKPVSYHGSSSYQYVFNFTDHLGNIRMSYADEPTLGQLVIMEENHNYPFGMKHEKYNSDQYEFVPTGEGSEYAVGISPVGPNVRKTYQYKYNGKEFQDELGLNLYDYGARNYDPALGRWMNIDPLAEKYFDYSNYNYTLNNPILFNDPDGMEIKGANKESAKDFHDDINDVFSDSKFDSFRALITRGKKNDNKRFDEINQEKYNEATKDLQGDDKLLADILFGAINSESTFVVEYFDGANSDLSSDGKINMENLYKEMGYLGIGQLKGGEAVIKLGGEGLSVPTKTGSHNFIYKNGNHLEGKRSLTSFHEVLGHGTAHAKGVKGNANHDNAIRLENLARKILKIQTMRDGTNPNHADGHKVLSPNAQPLKL